MPKQTTNYKLNQWEADDPVLHTDFNADNAKIDAALKTLESKVNAKASQTALDALSSTVSTHTASLTQMGNCQIATGTYTGGGSYGSSSPNSLSFDFQPKLVIIQSTSGAQMDITNSGNTRRFMLLLVRPLGTFYLYQGMTAVQVSWYSRSVDWYSDSSAYAQLNQNGMQYTYVAFG